ncbi:hypothetical protein HN747_03900 [archaeon]|jgi:FKBP-type peptidyl-prolyl cis-trans isomerase 2|nr:hypothetical protein [archaeon]
MALNKGDFIEIEFTGRMKDNMKVFDTNIESDAKEANLNIKVFKPFVLSIGSQMLPTGFDKDLEGKEVGKSYEVELTPEEGFGKRDKEMIKMIPTKSFLEQKINPQRGMQLALDCKLVRVLSNEGGRTLVDFNNPLAGRDVIYNYTIRSLVDKIEDKVNALQDFLFKRRFNFRTEAEKVIFEVEAGASKYLEMFVPKIKEILGCDVDVKIVEAKKDSEKKKEEETSEVAE